MKRCYLCATLLAMFSLFSCDDNDNPKPVPVDIVTFDVKENFVPSTSAVWAFIADDKGNFLDAINLVPGSKDTLRSSDKAKSFSLTILIHSNTTSLDYYSFETFTNVAENTNLVMGTPAESMPQGPPFAGYANFSVTDYVQSPLPTMPMLFSNGFYGGVNGAVRSFNTFSNNTVSGSVILPTQSSKILISSYHGTDPVYKIIDNVTNNANIDVSFNDFQVFPHVVDLGSGNTIGTIRGFDSPGTAGYTLASSDLIPSGASSRKLGYIDSFQSYYSYLVNYKGSETIEYESNTPPPSPFAWPSFDVQINNTSPQNFNFSTTEQFQLKRANWYRQDGNVIIRWTVNGNPEASLTIPKFPGEIAEGFPVLDFGQIDFEGVSIIKTDDNYTYEDFLKNRYLNETALPQLTNKWTYTKY